MRLAIEVAGALAAGGLVLLMAHHAGLRSRQAFGAIAIVPVAVAGVLSLPALRDAGASLLDQRKANAQLGTEQAQIQGGAGLGVNVDFLGWAGNHLGAEDTFRLIVDSPPAEAAAAMQWGLFQLAPHLETERPSAADWLIFYDTDPSRYRSERLGELDVYSPGFAVVRNSREG